MEPGPPNLPPLTPDAEALAPPTAQAPAFTMDNKAAELVADLIESTGLVPVDRLALVRGQASQGGSIAEALVAEGLASSEGVARMLAARHRLLREVAKGKESSIIDAYVAAIQRDEAVLGYDHDGYWSDVGTTERYAQAEHDAATGRIQLSARMLAAQPAG